MDPTSLVIISGLAILLIAAGIIGMPLLATRRWNKHKAETVARWVADGVTFVREPKGGKFGGLESTGVSRAMTGIGYIALTDKDLRVTRVTPFGAWIVSFRQIKSVTLRSAFLGNRSKKTPYIVVRFVQDGQADKLGFQVNDFEAWAADLAQAAGVSLKDQASQTDA